MTVPKNGNGNWFTCAICNREITEDYATMPTSEGDMEFTVHGKCKVSQSEPVSVETDDHNGEFRIYLVHGIYRCSRCDDQDRATGNHPAVAGVGTTEKEWKRHADTAHRGRKMWKYGNWFQTFS